MSETGFIIVNPLFRGHKIVALLLKKGQLCYTAAGGSAIVHSAGSTGCHPAVLEGRQGGTTTVCPRRVGKGMIHILDIDVKCGSPSISTHGLVMMVMVTRFRLSSSTAFPSHRRPTCERQ